MLIVEGATSFDGLCDVQLVKPIDRAKLLKSIRQFGLEVA